MGYTMEDYKDYEKLSDEERKGYATKQELVEKIEYPMTVQGQYDFMEDFLNRISHIKGNRGITAKLRQFTHMNPRMRNLTIKLYI